MEGFLELNCHSERSKFIYISDKNEFSISKILHLFCDLYDVILYNNSRHIFKLNCPNERSERVTLPGLYISDKYIYIKLILYYVLYTTYKYINIIYRMRKLKLPSKNNSS